MGLAAAKATIEKMEKKNVINHLYDVGNRLKKRNKYFSQKLWN